jgi:hypothetical protein
MFICCLTLNGHTIYLCLDYDDEDDDNDNGGIFRYVKDEEG